MATIHKVAAPDGRPPGRPPGRPLRVVSSHLLPECDHSSVEEVLSDEVVEIEALSGIAVVHLTGGTFAVELVVLTGGLVLLRLERV